MQATRAAAPARVAAEWARRGPGSVVARVGEGEQSRLFRIGGIDDGLRCCDAGPLLRRPAGTAAHTTQRRRGHIDHSASQGQPTLVRQLARARRGRLDAWPECIQYSLPANHTRRAACTSDLACPVFHSRFRRAESGKGACPFGVNLQCRPSATARCPRCRIGEGRRSCAGVSAAQRGALSSAVSASAGCVVLC
jgi:hypothetical protein